MCNTPQHPQIVANPQPEYHGPVYPGTTTLDREIAPLIQKLWSLGFETQASCAGWPVWTPGSTGQGYILFRDVHKAIDFFRSTYEEAANRGAIAPQLTLETATGLTDDCNLSATVAARGVIRFKHADLIQLEELWTA